MTHEEIFQLGKKLRNYVNIFDYIEVLGAIKSDKPVRSQNLIFLINTEKLERDLDCADKEGVSIRDAMLERWGKEAVEIFEKLSVI